MLKMKPLEVNLMEHWQRRKMTIQKG